VGQLPDFRIIAEGRLHFLARHNREQVIVTSQMLVKDADGMSLVQTTLDVGIWMFSIKRDGTRASSSQ